MLSLAKARKDYYLRKLGEISPREDYYLKGGTTAGRWHGSGAQAAGLAGRVTAEQLVRMFDGEHPVTGELLGRRLREHGVAAWDLTFSADKSVSLLWALGDETVQRHVLEAFEEATAEALVYLESVASDTRGGRRVAVLDQHGEPVLDERGNPRTRVETWPIKTSGYLAAWFTEFTSREDDPQVHTHVVIANRVQGRDGMWRTLDGRNLYRHQVAAGYVHEAELRKRLTERLGVRWQPVAKGMADVEGVTRDQIMEFSRRRRQINAARADLGVEDTPENNELIALATRRPKQDRSLDQLRADWTSRAAKVGLTPETVSSLLNRDRTISVPGTEPLFAELGSETGLTRERSTFGRSDAVAQIAAAFADGGTRNQIEDIADRYLQHRDVVPIMPEPLAAVARASDLTGDSVASGEHDFTVSSACERRYTTAELLATEQRIIDRAIAGVAAGGWRVSDRHVTKALAVHPKLTDGQRDLVTLFATSGNRVEVGVGAAGTGKSTALSIIRTLAVSGGAPIYGAAVAARAATGFETATGIPSTTLARLIAEASDGGLPKGVVLVVDEAGMVGTRQLARVSDLVDDADGKLILIGDHRQLPELEAGGLFRALAARLPSVELAENVRQRDDWERTALSELRDGSVGRALAMYRNHGRINTAATPADAIRSAVHHWQRDVAQTGDISQVLLIAHQNQTVDALNLLARQTLADAAKLHGPAATAAGKTYQAGDRVVCLKNRPKLGVLNGDLATITSVDPDRQDLTIRLDRNQEQRTLPSWYLTDRQLDYGYAITGHKAQGATARITHAVTTGSTAREWVYVTMSRGQDANILHLVQPGHTHDECDHILHVDPSGIQSLTAELGRQGAQTAAIDTVSR